MKLTKKYFVEQGRKGYEKRLKILGGKDGYSKAMSEASKKGGGRPKLDPSIGTQK